MAPARRGAYTSLSGQWVDSAVVQAQRRTHSRLPRSLSLTRDKTDNRCVAHRNYRNVDDLDADQLRVRDEQNGMVELAWRGRNVPPSVVSSDTAYYYLERSKTATGQDAAAGRALQDLMKIPPLNDDESKLLAMLTEGGHDKKAVRRALRVAQELVALFRRPRSPQPKRLISLTGSGDMWAWADARHRG